MFQQCYILLRARRCAHTLFALSENPCIALLASFLRRKHLRIGFTLAAFDRVAPVRLPAQCAPFRSAARHAASYCSILLTSWSYHWERKTACGRWPGLCRSARACATSPFWCTWLACSAHRRPSAAALARAEGDTSFCACLRVRDRDLRAGHIVWLDLRETATATMTLEAATLRLLQLSAGAIL